MPSLSQPAPPGESVPPIQVRVLGPDYAPLSAAELHRLFQGRRLTPARRERLAQSGRIVVQCGTRTLGVAAYDTADGELRVHECGVDARSPECEEEAIVNALLDALEVACLASAGRRLVLLPRAALSPALLRRRGFVTIAEGCSGSWFEKTFN